MDNNTETKNKVLVVDDEEMNVRMLKAFLCEDYDVQTALSGQEALEKAFADPPDLILLDVMMPGMDGYEVLSTLKKDDRTWKIPIIFITGLDSKDDEEKGLAMNAADYISKPLSVGIVKLRVKNQIQIVNQIRTIESLSLIDQLTGIPNRRNLDNRFALEWARALREKHPISLMMMDIDKFKVFNDTYGHLVGDDVLKLVAGSFEHALKRKSDFAARFGGEEFSVLLPNTTIDGATEIAERVRQGVEQLVIPCGEGKTTKVTLSIGVYSVVPTEDEDIPGVIAKADQALYEAKETGRNRVCVYGGASGGAMSEKPENVSVDTAVSETQSGNAPESNVPTAPADVLSAIGAIDGINLELGLSHFNKMENIYLETVQYFTERITSLTLEMQQALSAGDIGKFSITVHSVKSMLSTVGASGMSRVAAKLEAASKDGNTELCNINYPELHDKLTVLQSELSKIFPVESSESSDSAPPTSSVTPPADTTARKKIIHVDDVNYTLVSLKGRLGKYFEIYSVRSHDQLFKLLENVKPDLILLDVKMPEKDGFEIISELKADPVFADIPVVFLTSVSDDESISRCRDLGSADVIIKPISDADLITRIYNVFL